MSKVKTIEITQKELEKQLGEARQKAYDMGINRGRSEIFPYRTQEAVKAVILIDALFNLLDERYERIKEEY